MMRDRGMHFHGLDVLGLTVAGSLIASPGWYEHAMAYVPAPTAVYAVLGCIFLIVQILDKVGLLPRRRKRRGDDRDYY